MVSSFGIPFIMFYYHQLDLEHMTAAWLLPIVPTVVAAATGGVVAGVLSPDLAFVTLVISYMLWGIGMGLSFVVMALYFHRLTVHSLPNAEVAARLCYKNMKLSIGYWGFIFPLGVYTAATIRLAATLPSVCLAYLAMMFIAELVVIWVGVAIGTVQGALSGRLFQAPCLTRRLSMDLLCDAEPLEESSVSGSRK
ncbi:hypothetical protein WJX81_007663 [Elliptochloris bilobata]|uniref:Uncharacterized protein n=1 Tax=Elliptochloris bilobata TaxID=381761 RepID=A0AAW1S5R3_9CHLO